MVRFQGYRAMIVAMILICLMVDLSVCQTGVCMSERARGCTTDSDCCLGTCTTFPWGKQCRVNPLYKSPTAEPTVLPPSEFPSDTPTVGPTATPSTVPSEAPTTTAIPTEIPTTSVPTEIPTTSIPTTAAPTVWTDWVPVAPGYFATKGNQIINELNEPVRLAGINWFGFETYTLVLHVSHLSLSHTHTLTHTHISHIHTHTHFTHTHEHIYYIYIQVSQPFFHYKQH